MFFLSSTKHVLKSGKNQGFSGFQIAKFSYRKKNFRAARENFSRTTGEDIIFAVVGPQCGWSHFSLPPPQCLIQESRFQGGQLVLLPNIISSAADEGTLGTVYKMAPQAKKNLERGVKI